ncbi:MAG TPA: hypothetical protein VHE54_12415 [Puia sp.]|nr:hypothetical protein [Puia sp.]
MDNLKEYLLLHKKELDVDSPAADGWEDIASRLEDNPPTQEPGPAREADPRPGTEVRAKSRNLRRLVWYAAAACVIALAGVGSWLVIREKKAAADVVKTESAAGTKEMRAAGDAGAAEGTGAAGDAGAAGGTGAAGAKIDSQGAQHGRSAGAMAAQSPVGRTLAPHKAGAGHEAGMPDEIAAIDKSYSTLIDYQLKKLRAMPLYAENGAYFSFYVEQFKQMDRDEQAVRNDIKTYGLTGEFLEQMINVYQEKLNILKNLQTEINKMNNKVREKQSPTAMSQVHYLNI